MAGGPPRTAGHVHQAVQVAVGVLGPHAPAQEGPDAPWVDVVAPGTDLVSTCDVHRDGSGGFGRWSGSAFAAALVSGAIAARTGSGRKPFAAWHDLAEGCKRDERGRPTVPLRRASGWPSDGSA